MGKITWTGVGTLKADYFTVNLGGRKASETQFTEKGAENFATELAALYPTRAVTIISHRDQKKVRTEAKKRPWEGKNYYIEVNRYKGIPSSVSLYLRNGGGLVKTVSIYDVGLLYQYSITVPQMNYLEKLEKEAGIKR